MTVLYGWPSSSPITSTSIVFEYLLRSVLPHIGQRLTFTRACRYSRAFAFFGLPMDDFLFIANPFSKYNRGCFHRLASAATLGSVDVGQRDTEF